MSPIQGLSRLPPDDVYAALASAARGLSAGEAGVRLARDGPNELPEPARRALSLRFVDQLTHFMALLLWVAGILAFLSRTPALGWAIWAVIWINAVFSFWQEYRAERALAELRKVLPPQARVLRDGALRVIPARELVTGDLVQLEQGDRISADARLVAAEMLSVDLSVLTGESLAAERHPEAIRGDGQRPPDIPNLVLAGTTVTTGRGLAVVYATGSRTEFGRVAHLTATVVREPSTLERQVARIVRVITVLAVGMGAAVFLLASVLVGMQPRESFLFAIGIIVANVPEGLLPTVTLSLAMAVQRMARRRALVRRLSAVETLSATTMVCTDKTGTLTCNEMTVRALWVPGASIEITGTGYGPEGEVRAPPEGEAGGRARLLLAGAALCCDARLAPPEGAEGWRVIGDPTEGALLVAARKAGFDVERMVSRAPRLHELPFDAHRKMMSVVVRWGMPELWPARVPTLGFTKGAPLEVLARCRFVLGDDGVHPLGEGERAAVVAANDGFARQGDRVLAIAFRPDLEPNANGALLERDLTLIGLAAMLDPPRPGVADAVRRCREAGIAVTMVTGDYSLTALAVARRIGLAGEEAAVISGEEVDRLTDDALRRQLAGGGGMIFARVMPEQKLRLVQAYQALGHVVAVTGDGVNDAPALRAAHIGIAMGRSGTDVAREAADMVLLDDDFATIVGAIEQGREVYLNIRKFMTYILASNVPEMVPFIAMVALRVPPALNILQILAVDLGTDMVPALALGAEPPEAGIMRQPPRPKGKPLLDLGLLARGYGFLGAIEAAASLAAFFLVWRAHGFGFADVVRAAPALLAHAADARTTATYREATTLALAAIVAGQVGNLFACRSERLSVFRQGLFRNRLAGWGLAVEVGLLLAIVYHPALERIFGTAPLSAPQWVGLLLVPPLVLGAEEARKRFFVRSRRTVAPTP